MLAPQRVTYATFLVISWAVITPTMALRFWSGARTPDSLWQWVALWLFTVALPTVVSIRVHRRVKELVLACPDVPPRVVRDLTHVRWSVVMLGAIAALSAFRLGLER